MFSLPMEGSHSWWWNGLCDILGEYYCAYKIYEYNCPSHRHVTVLYISLHNSGDDIYTILVVGGGQPEQDTCVFEVQKTILLCDIEKNTGV